MSLLPQTIMHPSTPIGKVNERGDVILEQNWWLLFYNISQNVLGTGGSSTSAGGGSIGGSGSGGGGGGGTGPTGLSASSLIELNSLDADASDADAVVLRRPIDNLNILTSLFTETEIDAAVLKQFISNALILAQDGLLQDPAPVAQPVVAVTVGASPFSYVAPFNGQVSITGGTVSLISIIRQGVTVATGLITGVISASRLDTIQVTYTAAPTIKFLPL